MTNVDPNSIVKPEENSVGKGGIILKWLFIKDCDDVGSIHWLYVNKTLKIQSPLKTWNLITGSTTVSISKRTNALWTLMDIYVQ
jgi:hypothetical protein